MKFCFGDIVVVEGFMIGVVVKCWLRSGNDKQHQYEVYVRMYNGIRTYNENEIERYMVRHKYLDNEEMEWQKNAIEGN